MLETVQNLGGLHCRAEQATRPIARPQHGRAEEWPVPIRRTPKILDGLIPASDKRVLARQSAEPGPFCTACTSAGATTLRLRANQSD